MSESAEATVVQDRINQYWSSGGQLYDTHPISVLHMGDAAAVWREIWAGALPEASADVLDVGTGTGQVAMHLWQLGHRVTGVDLAEGMLDLARTKSNGLENPPAFLVGDAVNPPFPEASFDAIVTRYLLWTLREPQVALATWRRLLKPGGRLAIVDGLWLGGETSGTACGTDDQEFQATYGPSALESLTLAEATTIDQYTGLVTAAGFTDVAVRELPELYEIEVAHARAGAAGDELEVRMQYLITATT